MSARRVRSHAAILRGIAVMLVLCELASRAGVMPSVLGGGLAPLLELPFFAPALLGSFAAQILLRPVRVELGMAAVVALAVTWPLWSSAAASPFGAPGAVAAALGIGSIVAMTVSALRRRGNEREEVLAALLPALVLPGFVSLAHPMVYLTAVVWPTTYDHRMYLADAAFGAPLSFTIGRLTAAAPLLSEICLLVYVCLPLALMLVHALRQRRDVRSSDALVAFVAVTVAGYAGYHFVPVTGPVYVFGDAFPLSPPDPGSLDGAKSVVRDLPRNCMPSLHSAWALVVWWNARPLPVAARTAATAFLAITLLATVGLGFHYVVDLVAAFPLAMAAQAWATSVSDARLRRIAIASGAAMTLSWMALVTWMPGLPAWPPPTLWVLAAAVVAASSWLERRVYAARVDAAEAGATAPAPAGWTVRIAHAAAFLLGAAAWLHHAILSNALATATGGSPTLRVLLGTTWILGAAAGIGAAQGFRATLGDGGRIAAIASLALVAWSWTSMRLLPESSTLSSALLVVPGAVLAALVATSVAGTHGAASRGFFLLGAAASALLTGYAVLPSSSSNPLVLVLLVVVTIATGVLAVRAEPGGTLAARSSRRLLPVAAAIPLAVLLTTIAHLLGALLGDTIYARAQVTTLLFAGAGAGAFVALGLPTSRALTGSLVAAALAGALGLSVWMDAPGWFASFRGYIDEYGVMTGFSQQEFIRLSCAALLVVPVAAAAGAALAASSRDDESFTNGLAIALAAVCALATSLVLIPLAGSKLVLVTGIVVAAVLAAASILPQPAVAPAVAAGIGIALGALVLFAPGFDVAAIATGSALALRPSPTGHAVDVAESAGGVATLHSSGAGHELRVNGLVRAHGSIANGFDRATGRERALLVGLGDSAAVKTIAAAGYRELTIVEADPAVVAIARRRLGFGEIERRAGVVVRTDGARAVLAGVHAPIDLVRIDAPEVSGPEAASMCTRQMYALVAARLAPGGALMQELSLERLTPVTLASVLASARASFPRVELAYEGNRAVLFACDGCREPGPALPGRDALEAGRLRPGDVDALLADVAETLEVAVEALGSGDGDMHLRYQAPVSFGAEPAEIPVSRRLLASHVENRGQTPN